MHDLSLIENQISREVVDACIKVHTALGPGLFEKVYEHALVIELGEKRQLFLDRQLPIQAYYEGKALGEAYLADLIVEQKVILEIKSVERLLPVHFKQLLTYLRLADLKLGLLINFNEVRVINGINRVVNGL
jgi:GxxExxY protein